MWLDVMLPLLYRCFEKDGIHIREGSSERNTVSSKNTKENVTDGLELLIIA